MADDRPTVVILDSSIGVTGGLRGAARMARHLRQEARFILVLPREAVIPPSELQAFDEVARIRLVQLRRTLKAVVAYLPALLGSGRRLATLLNAARADVLVINDFFQMQGLVARLFGYRGRIVTWVRFDPRRFPALVARLWMWGMPLASDRVVAVSEFIRRRLPAAIDAELIYDPVDADLTEREAGACGPDIACVANYISGKGQDDAIEAFARITDRFPNTRLVFRGGDLGLAKNRAYRSGLEDRARRLGLALRIEFGGFAEDLGEAYAHAAVALNPSHSESFSLTCLEASQLGLPVVAYRSGGPEEIVVDGETGLLCDVGDVSCLAGALSRLLADPDRAAAMGKAAARQVTGKFATVGYVQKLRATLAIGTK